MMQISPNVQSGKTLQSQLELHHHSRSSLYVQFHLYLHSSNHRHQWDWRHICGMDDENNEPISHFLYTQLRVWLFVVGHALCFGSVLLKMWRIYYIFHHPTAKKIVGLLVIYQRNISTSIFSVVGIQGFIYDNSCTVRNGH